MNRLEHIAVNSVRIFMRFVFLVPVFSSTLAAQQERSVNEIQLQSYTPSALLRPGQIEVKQFNNLYTQTSFFDENGKRQEQGIRSTFLTSINNFLYGISPNFNIGFDLYLRSVRNDGESSSALSLFKFSSGQNSRTAFSQFGPKIKIAPFSGIPNLAIQTTLLFPLRSDLDGSDSSETPFLDVDGMQWWTQFFYDYAFQTGFLIYLESGLFVRFNPASEDFFTPLKAFVNYYPSTKWTVYVPVELTPFWDGLSWAAYYAQSGLGLKYQLFSGVEMETLYTKFLFGKSQGAGQTFNLGIRIIR